MPPILSEVYYYQPPANTTSPPVDSGLNHVSLVEGWDVEFLSEVVNTLTQSYINITTPVPTVIKLHWDQYSGVNPSYVQDLRVATEGWPNWKNQGRASYSNHWVRSDSFDIITHTNIRLASTSINNPLPLHFEFFDTRVRSEGIELGWEMKALEGEFVVERSIDGQLFEQVAHLDFSTRKWIDTSPREGFNSYRIFHRDSEGKIAYSATTKVRWQTESKLKLLSRNGNEFVFATEGLTGPFEILSLDGKLLYKKTLRNESLNLTVSLSLQRGNYLARVGREIIRFNM